MLDYNHPDYAMSVEEMAEYSGHTIEEILSILRPHTPFDNFKEPPLIGHGFTLIENDEQLANTRLTRYQMARHGIHPKRGRE